MIRTILVPLDGSATAERALDVAAILARPAGATIRLLHVRPLGAQPGRSAAAPDPASTLLEHAVARTARHGVAATTAVREGPIVSNIVAEAEAAGADLIVLSKHGATGPSSAWLGSVADGVARNSSVPLFYVRGDRLGTAEPLTLPLRRVLVPLDGSEEAEQVLDAVIPLARLTGAAITLLVVDVLPVLIGEAPLEIGTRVGVAEQWRRAESYLEALAPRLRQEGVAVDVALRAHQSAATAILDEARRVGAGVIAIATHGRSRMQRRFIGSVADKVLRGTDLPVLLVRPAAVPVAVGPAAAQG